VSAEPGGEKVDANKLKGLIGKLDRMNTVEPKARIEAMKPVFTTVPEPLDAHAEDMPGPTGETNILTNHARGTVLCLGPTKETAIEQMAMALAQGNKAVVVAPGVSQIVDHAARAGLPVVGIEGQLEAEAIEKVNGFDAVVTCAKPTVLKPYRQALMKRDGALLPLITEHNLDQRYVIERHLCVDTTAAGGNASLIAASE
jgi:RHH-type proline utilization regulon transcriptional repressor/proline dehydrogenase/delta 1-pyrroline-5-carboxylate dehydrogenase